MILITFSALQLLRLNDPGVCIFSSVYIRTHTHMFLVDICYCLFVFVSSEPET